MAPSPTEMGGGGGQEQPGERDGDRGGRAEVQGERPENSGSACPGNLLVL